MESKKLVILGLGQRGKIYADFAMRYPEKFTLAAVIDTDAEKETLTEERYPGSRFFKDYKAFLAANITADIVAVCTQDAQHKEHALAMLCAGYDLLLEKPVAATEKNVKTIYRASRKYGGKVIVCHVLRYTPFYVTVKKLIAGGRLGEIVSIHASENVGYFHQAHSYVRGPWRNKKGSSPMILAKCCHDMDIIRYLMDERCERVASFGSLYHFKKDNAPEGGAEYCSDCPRADCVYKAQTVYTAPGQKWCAVYFAAGKELTPENILPALRHSQYDRCVYRCDNDAVDHQVTLMSFGKGKTACHTMTAFSREIYRDIKIYGTKAELTGVMEDNLIEVRTFGGGTERINVDISAAAVGGHGGGDSGLMNSLYDALCGKPAEGVTYLDVSVESHLMSFAAERSRLKNGRPQRI